MKTKAKNVALRLGAVSSGILIGTYGFGTLMEGTPTGQAALAGGIVGTIAAQHLTTRYMKKHRVKAHKRAGRYVKSHWRR